MNSYPKYAHVKDKKYAINTDFRTALECEKLAKSNVEDEERALAIIYLLFGDKGLENSQDWQELLKIALKYLNCGKEKADNDEEEQEIDMDFEQDWEYIRTSFFYDYNVKLEQGTYMHWWEFYNLLCGLSDKCILNRVRFVRNFDIEQIKDIKEKEKWIKQKKQVALKQNNIKTAEEKRLDELFEKQLRGGNGIKSGWLFKNKNKNR